MPSSPGICIRAYAQLPGICISSFATHQLYQITLPLTSYNHLITNPLSNNKHIQLHSFNFQYNSYLISILLLYQITLPLTSCNYLINKLTYVGKLLSSIPIQGIELKYLWHYSRNKAHLKSICLGTEKRTPSERNRDRFLYHLWPCIFLQLL